MNQPCKSPLNNINTEQQAPPKYPDPRPAPPRPARPPAADRPARIPGAKRKERGTHASNQYTLFDSI